MACLWWHSGCPAGGVDPPGSQIFSLHASRRRDSKTDPGEESERARIGLLCEERSLWLPADVTRGVFSEWKQFYRLTGVNMFSLFQARLRTCFVCEIKLQREKSICWSKLLSIQFLDVFCLSLTAEHPGRVGKVAPAPQCSVFQRKPTAAWCGLPSGPQVTFNCSLFHQNTEFVSKFPLGN